MRQFFESVRLRNQLFQKQKENIFLAFMTNFHLFVNFAMNIF